MNDIQKDIEKQLIIYSNLMVNKFKWLTIKFEYCVNRNCFLLVYYTNNIEDDLFYMALSEYSNLMNLFYNNAAPLFCINESLFKLSNNAHTIKYKIIYENNKRNGK